MKILTKLNSSTDSILGTKWVQTKPPCWYTNPPRLTLSVRLILTGLGVMYDYF